MALAWVFERQQASDVARADQLLNSCGSQPWWVPALWHLEVANALLVAERRGVIQASGTTLRDGAAHHHLGKDAGSVQL